MLQRHKREFLEVKKEVARLGKKQKDEGDKMMSDMKTRHDAELASLVRRLSRPADFFRPTLALASTYTRHPRHRSAASLLRRLRARLMHRLWSLPSS